MSPLIIPWAPIEPILKVIKGPLHCAIDKSKEATSYNIFDGLAQSPSAMSAKKALQTCPTQWKALLSALGTIDPSNFRLMDFDLDNATL